MFTAELLVLFFSWVCAVFFSPEFFSDRSMTIATAHIFVSVVLYVVLAHFHFRKLYFTLLYHLLSVTYSRCQCLCVCVCLIIISAYLHCISTCTHSVHSFRLFMHAHITNKNVLIQLFDVYYRFKRFWKFLLLRFVLQLLHIRTHIPWYGAILHTHTLALVSGFVGLVCCNSRSAHVCFVYILCFHLIDVFSTWILAS